MEAVICDADMNISNNDMIKQNNECIYYENKDVSE